MLTWCTIEILFVFWLSWEEHIPKDKLNQIELNLHVVEWIDACIWNIPEDSFSLFWDVYYQQANSYSSMLLQWKTFHSARTFHMPSLISTFETHQLIHLANISSYFFMLIEPPFKSCLILHDILDTFHIFKKFIYNNCPINYLL